MGAVRLSLSVSGIETVLQSFNVIRVKRSTTGIGGTYTAITDNAPAPAQLVAPQAGNYDVASKTLQIKVDSDAQVDVLFSGLNPKTAAQASDEINTAVGSVIAADVAGTLVLTSTQLGTASKMEIVGGGAAVEFGWQAGDRDIGEDAHVQMIAGQSLYTYTDNDGESTYYYVAQFYNTINGLSSNDSSPFQGAATTLVSSDKLSVVKVDLVDGRGIAVPDQAITFYPEHEPLEVEGFQVALNRAPITVTTDNAGHAEVALVRGLKVRVVFEGSSIIRSITIPDAAETDLLSELGAAEDPYSVVEPPFPHAPRRTV